MVFARLSGETLTPAEEAAFDVWYSDPENRRRYHSLLGTRSDLLRSLAASEVSVAEAWNQVSRQLPKKRRTLYRRLWKYAAILLLPLAGVLFYNYLHTPDQPVIATVQPGYRQAVLIVDDHRVVDLAAETGQLNDRGIGAVNDTDRGLAYDAPANGEEPPAIHRVKTPRGGEYRLILADGTQVWLNSESDLRYPTHFSGDLRQVELTGEAYFRVHPDPEKPFVVRTADYDIRVTGTEFNVTSYSPGKTVATLVEGGVEVNREGRTERLAPGEQVSLAHGDLAVRSVDASLYTAWKSGEFCFSSTRLEDIMEQLIRWYDIEVTYASEAVKEYRFFARFKRDVPLDRVLSVLEQTNKMAFRLQGNSLTVGVR